MRVCTRCLSASATSRLCYASCLASSAPSQARCSPVDEALHAHHARTAAVPPEGPARPHHAPKHAALLCRPPPPPFPNLALRASDRLAPISRPVMRVLPISSRQACCPLSTRCSSRALAPSGARPCKRRRCVRSRARAASTSLPRRGWARGPRPIRPRTGSCSRSRSESTPTMVARARGPLLEAWVEREAH